MIYVHIGCDKCRDARIDVYEDTFERVSAELKQAQKDGWTISRNFHGCPTCNLGDTEPDEIIGQSHKNVTYLTI